MRLASSFSHALHVPLHIDSLENHELLPGPSSFCVKNIILLLIS